MAKFFAATTTRAATRKRVSSSLEINYAKCKRSGFGYRVLPTSYVQPIYSGRTPLCDEVLNDTLVSYPSSKRSFVSPKKTQDEEFVYQTEDERFEMDRIIEANKSTIQVLESVQIQLEKMSPESAKHFRLDDSLGGRSQVLHQRAVRRIYGAKAGDIIDGLKGNPLVNVPLVLERMKAKDEEWRKEHCGKHGYPEKQPDVQQSFPVQESTTDVTVARSKSEGRSAFVILCKDVFANRSISEPVPCYVCGKKLRLYNEKHQCWRTAEIVEHATIHLEPLFTCRICERRETSKRLMRSHLKVHPGAKITDYDDLSADNEEKIKVSIKSCFQEGAPKLKATSTHLAMRSSNHIEGHIAGSELKVQRHLHANQLVKDAASKAGFLTCRVCSNELNTIEPALTLKHAVGHLKKPLYQCKICSTTFFTTAVKMTDHVRKLHKGATDAYIDRSDQFHVEIMAMIEACFGDEYAKLDMKFDAEDPDGIDQFIESIKLAAPLLSEDVPSTKFLTFLIDKVIPVLPEIRGDKAENTRLEFLRLMADLSTYCGDLQEPMAKMDAVENALKSYLPVPPSETDSQEAMLQFSEIECLIYTLHQLGRRFPQHLSSAKKNEDLKELRKRFQYLALVVQDFSNELKQALMKIRKKEPKSDDYRSKQVALKTTSNISVLLKDLLREPPSYKASVDLSWKASEQKSAVG